MISREQAILRLQERIELFKQNLTQYLQPGYLEAHVRKEFIDILFECLGWDVDNRQGFAEQYKEVINEDAIKISGNTKAPDYAFRIGGVRKFFVEAKKPIEDIKNNKAHAFQIRRYAWNAGLPISILTNFKELSVYDCRVKPNSTDNAEVARISYYSIDEYISKFDDIYSVFSKDAILKGSFDRFAEKVKSKRGTSPIDKEFLREISKWREILAKNIASKNETLSVYELNYLVEKTIERILFLRICEDKSMEVYESLKELTHKASIYGRLMDYFVDADDKYNSGIFDLTNDSLSRKIKIDDSVIKSIVHGLYYPVSPYDFSVLTLDILGNVYERFLGETITLTSSHRAKVEEKPEVKKAGGVFYTPKYIVDYIVKNTLGEAIANKTPRQIERIKILDPACGSGSFLVAAYAYLLDYHLNWYLNNDPSKHRKEVFLYRKNQWLLTQDLKKRILLTNIFGVDIDPQAVEVTKLNLLLKVLENETKEGIYQQLKLFRERALPNLHENIKCGNSLVSTDILKNYQTTLIEEENRRINAFDWHDKKFGFGNIIEDGYDVIVGNPPYIQIQKLQEFFPREIEYIQSKYASAKEGNIDIYLPFIERSLQLLKPKGRLGMICPNRFFNSEYAQNLRLLLKEYNLYHLINFRHFLVFDNADAYTCLLFLQKTRQQQSIPYTEIRNVYAGKHETVSHFINGLQEGENVIRDNISPDFKNDTNWYFMSSDERTIFNKIDKLSKFGEVCSEFFVGIQTSLDDVFILKYVSEDSRYYRLFSKRMQKEFDLEKGIVRPIIDNTNISTYHVRKADRYVIFPYEIKGDTAFLLSEEEIKKKYLNAFEYLELNKKTLEGREKNKFKGKGWYAFGRNQNISKQHLEKILVPHVVKRTVAAIDEKGDYCLDNVGANGVILKEDTKEHPYYFIALLNSPISSFYISKISILLSGGFYASNKQFATLIPIVRIDFTKKQMVTEHDNIVECARSLIELRRRIDTVTLQHEVILLTRQIIALEAQINSSIAQLYGLSDKEMSIVTRSIQDLTIQ